MPALHRYVVFAFFALALTNATTLLSTASLRSLTVQDKRQFRSSNATSATLPSPRHQPCQCMAHSPLWQPPSRVSAKCVFIDLGAADGDTLKTFLGGGYGSMSHCPGGEWEAYLVEANPLFAPTLAAVAAAYRGRVHSLPNTAAYSCEANVSFYLDVEDRASNYGGSSMSAAAHPSLKRVGLQSAVVPTVNLMRLLYEHAISSDYVIVKMDIAGSEWDILPCLSRSPDAKLIDTLFLDQHSQTWQLGHTTAVQMNKAKAALKSIGIDMPQ